MPRKLNPTLASIRELNRIIWRLEKWQNRKDTERLSQQDRYDANEAKGLLMDVLNRMEGDV